VRGFARREDALLESLGITSRTRPQGRDRRVFDHGIRQLISPTSMANSKCHWNSRSPRGLCCGRTPAASVADSARELRASRAREEEISAIIRVASETFTTANTLLSSSAPCRGPAAATHCRRQRSRRLIGARPVLAALRRQIAEPGDAHSSTEPCLSSPVGPRQSHFSVRGFDPRACQQ
jgi:hypothetical protein